MYYIVEGIVARVHISLQNLVAELVTTPFFSGNKKAPHDLPPEGYITFQKQWYYLGSKSWNTEWDISHPNRDTVYRTLSKASWPFYNSSRGFFNCISKPQTYISVRILSLPWVSNEAL